MSMGFTTLPPPCLLALMQAYEHLEDVAKSNSGLFMSCQAAKESRLKVTFISRTAT
jgi:hypothetical protein